MSSSTSVAANHHHSHDDTDHHVHFDEKSIKNTDDFEEDNSIIYQKSDGNIINIHLGFLQINHRYAIDLKFQKSLFFNNVDNINLTSDDNHIPSLNCKVLEYQGIDEADHVCLKIEFLAHKEKLLRETLAIKNSITNESMKLMFHARVLGRGKGTPMLRNGIHSTGIVPDEEGESSDWPGFGSVDDK